MKDDEDEEAREVHLRSERTCAHDRIIRRVRTAQVSRESVGRIILFVYGRRAARFFTPNGRAPLTNDHRPILFSGLSSGVRASAQRRRRRLMPLI